MGRHTQVTMTIRARHRSGIRRLNEDPAAEATRVLRERYADFCPTLAAEKLAKRRPLDPCLRHG